MKLRMKLLSGFLIMAAMLLVAGIWAIYHVNLFGASLQKVLDENYKSIRACKVMIESLERIDSGLLLIFLKQPEKGNRIIADAKGKFGDQIQIVENNITISEEVEIIEGIRKTYQSYLSSLQEIPLNFSNKYEWYSVSVHPLFLDLKSRVENLMLVNERSMYDTARDIRNQASRAIMPGVVAIVASLILSLLFTYFMNQFIVRPILQITKGVEEFSRNLEYYKVNIHSRDELKKLNDAIYDLCAIIRSKGNG